MQLGGPRPRSTALRIEANGGKNGGGGDGIDAPETPTVVVEKEAEEATGVGEDGEGGHDHGAPQLSTQESGASLLSQFPPTQEMPRAVMQSPIPLPPRGERERAQPEIDDDAMRMSPPASAG